MRHERSFTVTIWPQVCPGLSIFLCFSHSSVILSASTHPSAKRLAAGFLYSVFGIHAIAFKHCPKYFLIQYNNPMKLLTLFLPQFYKWGIEGVTLLNTWPQCRKWQAGLRCELISNSGAPGYRHDDRQHSLCVLSKYLTMCRPVIPQTDAQSYLPLDSYQTPALLEQGPDHPCSFFPFLYLEPRNKLSHSKCTINWYLFKN